MNSRDTRLILGGAAVLLSLGMGIRPELRSVSEPRHPRSRGDGSGFHTRRRCAEHRLGRVAGADRRHRRSLRAARHDDGRCRAIYVLGLGVMAASAGLTGLLVSGVLIGVALSCTASSLGLTAAARAVPEVRRSRMLGIVAAAGSLGTFLIPLATQALLAREAWQTLWAGCPRRSRRTSPMRSP